MTPPQMHRGQPGWRVTNDDVSFRITETGGMIAPARFRLGPGRFAEPLAVAPWAEDPKAIPSVPILQALRGDFFCAPFGGNGEPWRGEKHPPHGEPANGKWIPGGIERRDGATTFRASFETRIRPGRIEKNITLRRGHTAIYCEHTMHGFSGPMPIGTHPCVRFPAGEGTGRISVGGWSRGSVLPVQFEDPAKGGYQSLKIGAGFGDLARVPLATGGATDLSTYPARRGFEDLVMLVGDDPGKQPLGWSAACFPGEGYAFLQLVDRRVLRHTVLWFSNAGRHYAPWSGRHAGVAGIEAVTANFHLGLAASANANPLADRGVPTCVRLDRRKPLRVAHILAVAAIPKGFDRVSAIERTGEGILLTAESGATAPARIDTGFLFDSAPEKTANG